MDASSYQKAGSGNSHICHSMYRLREVFFVVMMIFTVLTFISLIELQSGVDQHGWGFFLEMCFGKTAFLIPAIFTYFGWQSYLCWYTLPVHGRFLTLKLLGSLILFFSIVGLVQMVSGQGGELGNHLLATLKSHFLLPEIWVGVFGVFLFGLTLVTRISYHEIIIKITALFKSFFSAPAVEEAPYPNTPIHIKQHEYPISRSEPPALYASKFMDTQSKQLISALRHFDIHASVSDIHSGPVVTRYDLELSAGTKSSIVCSLQKDIARALAVEQLRIIEVISGTSCIGIELPNKNREFFDFNSISFKQLKHSSNLSSPCALPMALGKTVTGGVKVVDLEAMPHLLVAGSTQSGKTMLLQSILLSLTDQLSPEELQLILVDPKKVAFSKWESAPHLTNPIIRDASEAINALSWCVDEMDRRYQMMADNPEDEKKYSKIVVVVDEMSDLMMTHKNEVEIAICRLAQKARQSGIHLILSTQRPSADIITGHIKANITNRIALSVAERRDSRIILDNNGAETLLGAGDMLFKSWDRQCERLHAPYVSDDYIREHVSNLNRMYSDSHTVIKFPEKSIENSDPLYEEVIAFVKETSKASTSSIQRQFRIGFQRAANIIDQMEAEGIVGEKIRHNGPRQVLI